MDAQQQQDNGNGKVTLAVLKATMEFQYADLCRRIEEQGRRSDAQQRDNADIHREYGKRIGELEQETSRLAESQGTIARLLAGLSLIGTTFAAWLGSR